MLILLEVEERSEKDFEGRSVNYLKEMRGALKVPIMKNGLSTENKKPWKKKISKDLVSARYTESIQMNMLIFKSSLGTIIGV